MNNKLLGRLAGIAFVLGTVSGVASLSFVNVVNEENYLNLIAKNPNGLAIGGLLVMLMGISCATIACWIYPVLNKHHKGLAISAVGLRTVEGAITLLSAITFLALIPIAKEYAFTGNEAYLVAGNTVKGINDVLSPVLGIVFSAGALMYNIGFCKSKLIPRWISIWGIIALTMHIVASVLYFYGVDGFSATGLVLNMPIALQEMVMAVYLIIFGFRDVEVKV